MESLAEDLSDGVKRRHGAAHPAAAARRALNKFKFQLPTTLPSTGAPSLLTSEIHSFSRVFTGCFYDLIRNIFTASSQHTEAELLAASQIAGKLLIEAARKASLVTRFFQSVGRAMVLADQTQNGGTNRALIGQAFASHSIFLGANSILMPKLALAGSAPVLGAKSAVSPVEPATLKDLRKRIGASPTAKFTMSPVNMGKERLLEAVHHRRVPLDKLGKQLRDVVALAPEAIMLGASGASAAAFSALPDAESTHDEVLKFVETLLENDRIAFEPPRRVRAATALDDGVDKHATHAIATQRGEKVLKRVRFSCRH